MSDQENAAETTEKPSRTAWACEKCGKTGLVEYPQVVDVYTVVQLLEDDHARVSPACPFDVSKVRVSRAD